MGKKFGDNLSIDRELLQGLSQRSDITKFLFRITTVCVIRVEEGGAYWQRLLILPKTLFQLFWYFRKIVRNCFLHLKK